MSWSRSGYATLLLMSLLWVAGILASPLLFHVQKPVAGTGIRMLYSPVCHQDVQRTHHVFHWPMAVCHRCSGVYFSFTLVVLFFPLLKRWRFLASFSVRRSAIFILPMFLDYMLDVAGVWVNSPISRTVSGSIAGIGLAFFTIPAWMEAWSQLFNPTGKQSESTQ